MKCYVLTHIGECIKILQYSVFFINKGIKLLQLQYLLRITLLCKYE
jgi:hypothetical protein